jgi:hypothetical protein
MKTVFTPLAPTFVRTAVAVARPIHSETCHIQNDLQFDENVYSDSDVQAYNTLHRSGIVLNFHKAAHGTGICITSERCMERTLPGKDDSTLTRAVIDLLSPLVRRDT